MCLRLHASPPIWINSLYRHEKVMVSNNASPTNSLLADGTKPLSEHQLIYPLQWRHNERDGVSNHQPHDCLLNCLFRSRSSKLRVTGLCEGDSRVTGEFPSQSGSNAENVSIWRRHHAPQCIFCWNQVYLPRKVQFPRKTDTPNICNDHAVVVSCTRNCSDLLIKIWKRATGHFNRIISGRL